MLLPQELVTSILVNLPAKSLSCFKCVCKTWQAIIDDPSFMDQRLKKMNGVSSTGDLFLINTYHPCAPPMVMCLLSDENAEIMDLNGAPSIIYEQINGAQINIGEEIPPLMSTISGPINGVYCIMTMNCDGGKAHSIMVWNPGNGQVHVLPPIPRPVLPDNLNFERLFADGNTIPDSDYDYTFDDLRLEGFYCGFGYDHSSNDYKFVCISEYGDWYACSIDHFALFHVYSLGSNSWHQLDPHQIAYPSLITLNDRGRPSFKQLLPYKYAYSFGNECHWLYYAYGHARTDMVSFDFVNHVFRVTCVPETVVGVSPNASTDPNTLTTVDGCLAIVYRAVHDNGTSMFTIGVMRDQSWTVAYKITLNTTCTFLAIVEDEFFVREEDGWVVSYSVGDHQQEGREYCQVPLHSRLLPFKGSLVPVKPCMENNGRN